MLNCSGKAAYRLLYRFRKLLKNAWFDHQTRRVLDTPPIEYREAPLCVVSMVNNRDVQMYILAIKALYRRLGRGKLVAIIDPDFPDKSRALIHRHLGPIEFVPIAKIDTGSCQRGGTWERVIYCVERSVAEYVIQIDADVLCFGQIPEVEECIRENRAFSLAEGLPVKPLADWVRDGQALPDQQIVIEFERRAAEFPDAETVRYVRASSGFTGFAKGAIEPRFLQAFHANGQEMYGDRWKEWGTEQLASNFAVANSPGGTPLPNPKYASYVRQEVPPETSVLHFIGAFRFQENVFVRLANREIDALLAAGKK